MEAAATKRTRGAKAPSYTSTSTLDFHGGGAISLASQQYPRLAQSQLEGVQNCIDEDATHVEVRINRKTRTIWIRDNGTHGVTRKRFEEALAEVARSQKARGKLGQFGCGVVAAYGKCEQFSFITRMLKDDGVDVWRWMFNCDAIKSMRKIEIPLDTLRRDVLAVDADLYRYPFSLWTTELQIENYTTDRTIGKIDVIELQREILQRYGAKMRRNGAVVVIIDSDEKGKYKEPLVVKATEFQGRPLEPQVVKTDDGTTTVRLFLMRKTGRDRVKGEVSVGVAGSDFRIPVMRFARQAEEVGGITKECIDGLTSGIFEGEVTHDRIKLLANREQFNPDDAFLDLCVAIDSWFLREGKQFVEKAQDQHREDRLHEITQKAEANLAQVFRDHPEFQLAMQDGYHADADGTKVGSSGIGGTPQKREPTTGSGSGGGGGGGEGSSPEKPRAPAPLGGKADESPVRAKKGGPDGLKFKLAELESAQLYQLDVRQGTLTFNTTHPLFLKSEKGELNLRRFEEVVAIYAIREHMLPPEERRFAQLFFHDGFGDFVASILVSSPSFVPFGRPKKVEADVPPA